MRLFIRGFALASLGAVPFMIAYDIPFYVNQYLLDQAAGKHYFDAAAGFYDAAYTRHPSQTESVWYYNFFWMSLYFSVAVWSSIMLMWAPGRVRPEFCDCTNSVGGALTQKVEAV